MMFRLRQQLALCFLCAAACFVLHLSSSLDAGHRAAREREAGARAPAAAAQGAAPAGRPRAGILYMRLADPKKKVHAAAWPPWLPAIEAAAEANADEVTFYFAGEARDFNCRNCVSIPTDLDALLGRIEAHLGIARGDVGVRALKATICDLKPMWPALFPEVAAAHEFVGYADLDVLFGDLASEVRALRPGDDLLAPSSWFPAPLSNGNFLLLRSAPRVLDLFRDHPGWRDAVTNPAYDVYDEWHGPRPGHTFMSALLEAHLDGKLKPKPTEKIFLQDVVASRNLWDRPANVGIRWTEGKLVATYDGPCRCPKDIVPQFTIAQCAACVRKRGHELPDVPVSRRLEILAYHLLSAKHHVLDAVDPGLAACASFDLAKADDSLRHSFACRDASPGAPPDPPRHHRTHS